MRLETFFFICAKKKFFFLKLDNIFMGAGGGGGRGGKWKKKNCGRPTAFNFSHPLDRKQILFYGQPQVNEL